ncbi:MAG: hypothetical protein ACFFD6_05265 [Candidatus Thorarchaeota archaeon]
MSEENVVCPACGDVVPIGRYCKSCGERLPVPETPHLEEPTSIYTSEPDLQEEEEFSQLPQFDMSVDEMDSVTFARVMSRAELQVIQKELDDLIGQIQATRQALQLKQADKALLTARAEQLRISFDRTKKRREELRSGAGKIPLEKKYERFKEFEEKLSKLEDAEDSLDSAVFKEQRDRIISTLKALKKDLKSSIKNAEKWLKNMKKTRRTLDRDSSRLDAQYRIGDISAHNYEESKARIEKSIQALEIGRTILDEIIENAKQM